MADADIATVIVEVKQGIVSFDDFCKKIKPYDRYNQNQLSFHSNDAVNCLELSQIIDVGKEV